MKNLIFVLLAGILFLQPTFAQETSEADTPSASTEEPKTAELPKTTEEPKAVEPNESPSTTIREDRWRFTIGMGLMVGDGDSYFPDATFTDAGGSTKGTAKLNYKRTYMLILEGRRLPQNSWGLMGGLNIEGERQLDNGKLNYGSTEVTLQGNSDASKVQFFTGYVTFAYRWEHFFLPFGLNYSAVRFVPAKGVSGSHEAEGRIGAHLGVGAMLTPHFSVEAYSWVTSMDLRTTSGTDTADYGLGLFRSINLNAKYIF